MWDGTFEEALELALNKPAPWYVRLLQQFGLISVPFKVESPSMQIAKHIAMLTVQKMERPKDYRGLQLKHRNDLRDSLLNLRKDSERFNYYSLVKGKGKDMEEVLIFSNEECSVISEAVHKAANLKKEHDNLTYEAGRQQKAIDILCGTYSKPTTVGSLEKSTPNMQLTSTKNKEEDSLIATVLITGGTYRGLSMEQATRLYQVGAITWQEFAEVGFPVTKRPISRQDSYWSLT